MLKLLFFIFCLIQTLPSISQDSDLIQSCGYYGDNAIFTRDQICDHYGFMSNDEAELVVEKIMERIGLQPNFIVLECPNLNNAFAVNLKADIGCLRYIIYDNHFLEKVDFSTETDWAAVSIIAHEIGHHLNGHTLDGVGSRPDKELESDEFSGFALQMLGASLEQAQAAMNKLASERDSQTHPGKSRRLAAIERGWKNAEALAPKYKEISRNADYTSIAKKWFLKAYNINGNTQDDYVKRAAYYGKATEYKADYVDAYRNRAKNLNALGLYKEAIKDANRAISIDPNHWNSYSEKASGYFGLKKYGKAIEIYELVIERRPDKSAYDFAARGWAYHLSGNKERAVADLKIAVSLKPEWQDARQKLEQALR